MALIDLSSYSKIETAVFIKLSISGYGDANFSNYRKSYTIGSDTYNSLGSLLSISEAASDLTASDRRLTISLSGIPQANNDLVQDYEIKGSLVTITRAFFDAVTGEIISVSGNPAVRFKGLVTNFSLAEEFSSDTKTATNSIILDCASNMVLLKQKIGGRRTNPDDFPTDKSFDRIPQLNQSNFQFGGKPK
mgnify:FL=1